MAFQFATIGAIAPLIGIEFQIDAVAIGTLIGIYFSPGIVVALPGGAIASRMGDKRVVLAGLALMAARRKITGTTGRKPMPIAFGRLNRNITLSEYYQQNSQRLRHRFRAGAEIRPHKPTNQENAKSISYPPTQPVT